MERIIKFRAWDTEVKCFISQIQLENIFWDIVNGKHKNRFILMQYTGWHDYLGEDIYEGDIIIDTINPKYKTVVEYEEFFHYNKGSSNEGIGFDFGEMFDNDKVKIIGNVWDNPELLKEK